MTRASPRANFNSSRLIRFLTDLALSDVEASQQHFAERLGQFFDFSDAILLSAAHEDAAQQSSAIPFDAKSTSKDAVEEEFLQVRSKLVNAIVRSCTPNAGSTRIKLPAIKAGAPIEAAAAFEPYHRFYAAHQRDIDSNVRNLRSHIRDTLSTVSPQLRQLAVLDAALDDILWDRTRKLFATTPKLLEKRFEHLFTAHQKALAETQHEDDRQHKDNPAQWMQPGGWLERFCKELQELLLAELEVRLQPVLGLVEALNKELKS